jgi:hypothetical protein
MCTGSCCPGVQDLRSYFCFVEAAVKPKVAVIREEGSNGDREMAAALQMAGFEVWDVNMQDLSTGVVTLDRFRGIVFVGGFSYADVFGSAKGNFCLLLLDDFNSDRSLLNYIEDDVM